VEIRALTRSTESAGQFQRFGVEPAPGDLRDRESLIRACNGVSTVIATANAAVPSRASDTFEAVDRFGYRNLIDAAKAAGIQRFVYTSAPASNHTKLSPLVQCKRETEQAIVQSGLDSVIFRAGVLMDVAFAMMGSTIPIRNAENATVLRPFPFARRHFARIQDSIEQKHVAMIPGDGRTKHGFLSIDNAADFLVSAAFGGPAGVYSLGGPEALTYLDVVRLFEQLLGVALRVKRTPAIVFRIAARVLRTFSPAGANLMAINYIAATEDSPADNGAAAVFGVGLTSAGAFLRARSAATAALRP
jgi:uncharacterized protein YbjT (DUF2867 family)